MLGSLSLLTKMTRTKLSFLPDSLRFIVLDPLDFFLSTFPILPWLMGTDSMASFISKAIKKAAVYAYGLFTVVLYALISVRKGTYFKQRTEKEHLELQLGASSAFFVIFRTHHRTSYEMNTACSSQKYLLMHAC